MKKILLTICAIFLSTVAAMAEKGDVNVGVNISYPTEQKGFGLGVKGQYGITDHVRGELSWENFFENDGVKEWDLNLDIHYLLSLPANLKLYPLVGLHYSHFNVLDHGKGFVGFNLGAGIEYALTDSFTWNIQGKYSWSDDDLDQGVISTGIVYHF